MNNKKLCEELSAMSRCEPIDSDEEDVLKLAATRIEEQESEMIGFMDEVEKLESEILRLKADILAMGDGL